MGTYVYTKEKKLCEIYEKLLFSFFPSNIPYARYFNMKRKIYTVLWPRLGQHSSFQTANSSYTVATSKSVQQP